MCESDSRSPGRARRKPLKPLRREGRIASAEPVCSCAFSYVHLHTRPRVQRAPGFPCALYFLRVKSCARLGHFMPRECGPMPSRRLKIQRENAASNAWPAEEIAKHHNSPNSTGCLSKAGVGGFSSVSSTRGGQTMNPVTLVTPTVRLLASRLSHDQQRAIGSERYRVPAQRHERSL